MKFSALLLSGLFLAINVSSADEAAFAKYDANRDGNVTYAELARAKKLEFDRLDRNRDKSLTEQEFGAAPPKEEGAAESFFDTPAFAALDADKNGSVSLAEFGTSIKNTISMLDKSADTAVSKDEYVAAAKAQAEAAAKSGTPQKKGSAAKKGSTPKKPVEVKKTDT